MLIQVLDKKCPFFGTILAVYHINITSADAQYYDCLTATVQFLEHGICAFKVIYNDNMIPHCFELFINNKVDRIFTKNELLKIFDFNPKIKSWIERF